MRRQGNTIVAEVVVWVLLGWAAVNSLRPWPRLEWREAERVSLAALAEFAREHRTSVERALEALAEHFNWPRWQDAE
jgi:hypothetical protein